jgi:single-strand DNA-binding protein
MNKVILMGRLTKEPDLRYTNTSNIPVCRFTLAIDRKYTKQGEEKQTDFIPIVAWNKLAEFCGKYFLKGRQVVIVGKMQNRTWDDNEGKRHYITEVMADEAYFADGKRDGEDYSKPMSTNVNEGQPDGFFPLEVDDELPF